MITYQNRGSQLKETMGKSKAVIISAMFFIGALPFVSQAYAEAGPDVVAPDQAATPSPNAPAPHAAGSHDVQSFFIDSREFKIGDIVPDIYRTKPYEIVDWSARHLPPPEVGSHWTYMGGNYVLITDGEGKMLKAESGDIFSPM
jgi:Ni/Co efflux regulator RcnB